MFTGKFINFKILRAAGIVPGVALGFFLTSAGAVQAGQAVQATGLNVNSNLPGRESLKGVGGVDANGEKIQDCNYSCLIRKQNEILGLAVLHADEQHTRAEAVKDDPSSELQDLLNVIGPFCEKRTDLKECFAQYERFFASYLAKLKTGIQSNLDLIARLEKDPGFKLGNAYWAAKNALPGSTPYIATYDDLKADFALELRDRRVRNEASWNMFDEKKLEEWKSSRPRQEDYIKFVSIDKDKNDKSAGQWTMKDKSCGKDTCYDLIKFNKDLESYEKRLQALRDRGETPYEDRMALGGDEWVAEKERLRDIVIKQRQSGNLDSNVSQAQQGIFARAREFFVKATTQAYKDKAQAQARIPASATPGQNGKAIRDVGLDSKNGIQATGAASGKEQVQLDPVKSSENRYILVPADYIDSKLSELGF